MPRNILDAIAEYHESYRHPSLPRPEASGIYELFPGASSAAMAQHRWPESWPNANRPGVYFIFGSSLELLYVGKASWLGRRLGNYFQFADGRASGCKIVHSGWKTQPAFIATVALSKSFEAASMEEFLIGRLCPAENTLLVSSVGEQLDNAMLATGEGAPAWRSHESE